MLDLSEAEAEVADRIRESVLADLRGRLNRNFWTMIAVFVLLLALGAAEYATTLSQNADRVAADIRQCTRLQEQRAADNGTAFRQKVVITLLTQTLLNSGLVNLLHGAQLSERLRAAMQLKTEGAAILYEPPTICPKAVRDTHYKRPPPTPFPKGYQPPA